MNWQDANGARTRHDIDSQWALISAGNGKEDLTFIQQVVDAWRGGDDSKGDWKLGEWLVGDSSMTKPSPLLALWQETFQQPIIPYSMAERLDQLPHAFEALAPWIERHKKRP